MSRRLVFSLSLAVVSAGLDGLKYWRAIPICHSYIWQPDGGRWKVGDKTLFHQSPKSLSATTSVIGQMEQMIMPPLVTFLVKDRDTRFFK